MSETNESSSKKKVMVTGGTGLVGQGIKEFVSTDSEVICSLFLNVATFHKLLNLCAAKQRQTDIAPRCLCEVDITEENSPSTQPHMRCIELAASLYHLTVTWCRGVHR